MPARVVREPTQLRLTTLAPSGNEAFDLTSQVEGLSWSNVDPGGDERCTFELKRKWFAGAPEIAQTKLVRVTDGLDILFMGRIEENNRAVADSEKIGVTAYGLGVRLKDKKTYRDVIVDRDPSHWADAPLNEKIRLATAGVDLNGALPGFASDRGLVCSIPNQAFPAAGQRSQAWYIGPFGVTVAKVMYAGSVISLPAGWTHQMVFAAGDQLVAGDTTNTPTLDGTLRTSTPSPTRGRYVVVYLISASTALTPAAGSLVRYDRIAVYGNTGITTRSMGGTDPDGVYDNDVVSYLVGLASGVTARRIDANQYVIGQLAWFDDVTLEQAIIDTSRYANPGVSWGTWGPDSVLDTTLNGQFDWRVKDLTTQHWYTPRSGCDDISLNVELATLFNSVDVHYVDAAGAPGVETRTAVVPTLDAAGITRPESLNGGTLTQSGAQQLGDAFLALSAQRPPARGTVQLSGPVTHYRRGQLPPHCMRADGSNLRLPDVLPSEDALSLSTGPDRRTTFPIKRITVDAGGQVPKVTVDVDQSNDTLAILNARLQQAAFLALGR